MATALEKKVAIGIDLGTSYSAIAVYENGRTRLLVNDRGSEVTPSVVAFLPNRRRVVGYRAADQSGNNPKNTVTEIKRLMGHKFHELSVQEDMSRWTFEVIEENGLPRIRVLSNQGEETFSPEQISALILVHLKNIACGYFDIPPSRRLPVVITVPVHFGDSHRTAVLEACEIAGIDCVKIITEPAAAAIAYAMEDKNAGLDVNDNVLVFDMGGGTTDISILNLRENNEFRVVACTGDSRLGGEDLDTLLYRLCEEHIYEDFKVHLNNDYGAQVRLRSICQQAKCILSSSRRSVLELDELKIKGQERSITFNYTVTRNTFEELADDIFHRAINLIKTCMQEAKMKPENIKKILMAGGSSRIPKLQQMISETLPSVQVLTSLVEDEIVARGAALQAASEIGEMELQLSLSERIPWSLGINDVGGYTIKILSKNSLIPNKETEVFRTAHDRQTGMQFMIYEGENVKSEQNRLLGNMTLKGIRVAAKGMVAADVTFEVDKYGILRASAVEQGTNNVVETVVERYKKEIPPEEMEVIHERAQRDNLLHLLDRMLQELKQLHTTAANEDELTEEQLAQIHEEMEALIEFINGTPNPTPQHFTSRINHLKENLKFCCTVSNTGKITYNIPADN